jgi:hypothetical protein
MDREKLAGAPGASGQRREAAEAAGMTGDGRRRVVKRVAMGTTGNRRR